MRFKDAMMLASVVTGVNVLIQSAFAIVGIFEPLAMLQPGSVVEGLPPSLHSTPRPGPSYWLYSCWSRS